MGPVFPDPIYWLFECNSHHDFLLCSYCSLREYLGYPKATRGGYCFHEVAIGPQEAKAQSDAIALLARKQELSTDSLQVPLVGLTSIIHRGSVSTTYLQLVPQFWLVEYHTCRLNGLNTYFVYSTLNKLRPRKRIRAKQSHVRITWFLKHFEAF